MSHDRYPAVTNGRQFTVLLADWLANTNRTTSIHSPICMIGVWDKFICA